MTGDGTRGTESEKRGGAAVNRALARGARSEAERNGLEERCDERRSTAENRVRA